MIIIWKRLANWEASRAVEGQEWTNNKEKHLLPELNDGRGGILMVTDRTIPLLNGCTRILNEVEGKKRLSVSQRILGFLWGF